MKLQSIKNKINKALDDLYNNDFCLIKNNLCERCINHRLAVYLEKQNFENYYVDCEYNKSHLEKVASPKKVSNINGNYIDIIITKRDGNYLNDLICFEVKKYNNHKGRSKDRDNLKILTGGDSMVNDFGFGYDYGFYIIFGSKRGNTIIETYKNGKKISDNKKIKEKK
ncbi:MAG: hypothetical protein PHD33_05510 [Atribacterota bacterium]|nr:hypothetical protein [Atribacterota bacterium]